MAGRAAGQAVQACVGALRDVHMTTASPNDPFLSVFLSLSITSHDCL